VSPVGMDTLVPSVSSSRSAESRVETGLDELVPVSHEATNKCNLKIFVSADNSRFLVPER